MGLTDRSKPFGISRFIAPKSAGRRWQNACRRNDDDALRSNPLCRGNNRGGAVRDRVARQGHDERFDAVQTSRDRIGVSRIRDESGLRKVGIGAPDHGTKRQGDARRIPCRGTADLSVCAQDSEDGGAILIGSNQAVAQSLNAGDRPATPEQIDAKDTCGGAKAGTTGGTTATWLRRVMEAGLEDHEVVALHQVDEAVFLVDSP